MMVMNTDSHSPEDLISRERASVILSAAGIPAEGIETIFANSQQLVERVGRN